MPTTRLADEADAYELFERLRWGGTPDTCPHCRAAGKFYYLRPESGRARRTRTGRSSARRVWRCASCRRQFSVLTGTVFEGTRVGLLTWVAVIAELVAGDLRPVPGELVRRHGVTAPTAAHMLARLAAAGLSAANGVQG